VRREFFETPLPARSASTKPILLNVGVIAPLKRQLDLLALLDELHHAGYSFETHFIGAADPRNRYAAAFLQQIRAAERKKFIQHSETKSLGELIAAFDTASALIHIPSEEAFGLVAAEALSRNLKFFGSRTGGLLDITQGVDSAELFAGHDQVRLRDAIANWIELGCLRPADSASIVRERNHPDVIARRHEEIYRDIFELT
jgi:glycosyltransferase involved in cell wall biosynthesis